MDVPVEHMTEMPKWVDKVDYSRTQPYVDKLTKALEIAWEALEKEKNGTGLYAGTFAFEAMQHIEALGGEEKNVQ